jgi:polygalacturonase
MIRRDFLLRGTSSGLASVLLPAASTGAVSGESTVSRNATKAGVSGSGVFDVRRYGATGNGKTIDTPAVNRAIEAAAAVGGGTVHFPAGTYACYSIRLKSHVALFLDAGATILAADVPLEGTTTGGYDPAGPPQPWEAYQSAFV